MDTDQLILSRLDHIQTGLDESLKDRSSLNVKVERIETTLDKLVEVIGTIDVVNKRLDSHDERLNLITTSVKRTGERLGTLENAPLLKDANIVRDVKSKIQQGLLMALAGGVVAVIVTLITYALRNPIK